MSGLPSLLLAALLMTSSLVQVPVRRVETWTVTPAVLWTRVAPLHAARSASGRSPLPHVNREHAARGRDRTLTITAYAWTGSRAACGPYPAPGMVASNLYRCGQRLRIQGVGDVTVQDRVGCCTDVDVFLPSQSACLVFGRQRRQVQAL